MCQKSSAIKRRGENDAPGAGEPIYPARWCKAERSISWLNNVRKLQAAGALGVEGGEPSWAMDVGRCAHQLNHCDRRQEARAASHYILGRVHRRIEGVLTSVSADQT